MACYAPSGSLIVVVEINIQPQYMFEVVADFIGTRVILRRSAYIRLVIACIYLYAKIWKVHDKSQDVSMCRGGC